MQLYTKILVGMVLGAVLGSLVGPNSSLLPQTAATLGSGATVYEQPVAEAPVPLARGLKTATLLEEKDGWVKVQATLGARDLLRLKDKGVAEAARAEGGTVVSGWVADEPGNLLRFAPLGQALVESTEWVGQLFLALIKMVVVPLVFCSLLVGVAGLGDFRRLGRLGGRTIGYFVGTTVVALLIGVGLANLVAPGRLVSDADKAMLLSSFAGEAGGKVANAAAAPSFGDQIVGIVPTNPIRSMADGDMLQVIFFALILGVALTFLRVERARPVVDLVDRVNDAMVMMVQIVMKLAPYGVAVLLFKVAGTTGPSVLGALGAYALVVLAGLLVHLLGTYGLVVRYGAGLSFPGFLGAMKEAMLLAFSTSSSSATLPVTMQCAQDRLGVSNQTASFVLPLGATVNMDGTALYQGVAAVFIAQIYGMHLSLSDQATIVGTATLASIGAAGVPGAGMITLAMVLTAVGVPTEGLALVLGVDRLLDMFRTCVNVVGDATATVVMARLEGEQLRIVSDAEDVADKEHGFEGRLDREPSRVQPTDDPLA